jgi:hypothetical protein
MGEDQMPATTTIRLSDDLKAELESVLEGKSMNTFITQLIQKHVQLRRGRPIITVGTLRRQLVDRLADHLRNNDHWIPEALLDPDILTREGESIFAERSEHFADEKELIAARFIPWLERRILQKIDEGYNVYLVIDSGTTLHAAFQVLQEELITLAKAADKIAHLAILTNNTAIVKAYTSRSTHLKFIPYGGQEPIGISDVVHCYVLGGRLFSRYAALTGPETVAALLEAKRNPPLVKAEEGQDTEITQGEGSANCRRRPAFFVALLVGQWLRISESSRRHAVPLARGHGQKPFKETLIKICEEIYLLSPLGKLFLLPEKDIQVGLGGGSGDPFGASKYYEDVPIEKDRDSRIKLVSTYRPSEEKNVLGAHSSKIRAIYPRGEAAAYDPKVDDFIGTEDIKELPMFFYAFDDLAARTYEGQRAIEFPHIKEKSTDTKERAYAAKTKLFMMQAFSVPAHMRGD